MVPQIFTWYEQDSCDKYSLPPPFIFSFEMLKRRQYCVSHDVLLIVSFSLTNSIVLSFCMQNLIATKLGVQRITGITVFDKIEKITYDSLPDLEVGDLWFLALFIRD